MTILITRPFEQAQKTAQLLENKGYTTLVDPLLDISPLNPTPYDASKLQAVLFTSVYGARFCPGVEKLIHLPVFAVGPSTAQEAKKRGFASIHCLDRGASKELCTFIASHLHRGAGDVLYCSGKVLATDSVNVLQQYGFSTQRIIVYNARSATTLSSECHDALLSHHIRAALFFSPRTLSTFAILIKKAKLDHCCASIAAICLSDPIQKGARSLPFKSILCADAPRMSRVFALLEHHFTPMKFIAEH